MVVRTFCCSKSAIKEYSNSNDTNTKKPPSGKKVEKKRVNKSRGTGHGEVGDGESGARTVGNTSSAVNSGKENNFGISRKRKGSKMDDVVSSDVGVSDAGINVARGREAADIVARSEVIQAEFFASDISPYELEAPLNRQARDGTSLLKSSLKSWSGKYTDNYDADVGGEGGDVVSNGATFSDKKRYDNFGICINDQFYEGSNSRQKCIPIIPKVSSDKFYLYNRYLFFIIH